MAGEFDVSGWVRREGMKAMHQHQVVAIGFIQHAVDLLSDPKCEGSEEVLKAIMRKRASK